jgi:ubiquinone/menaquinone biosynthesis C-methylase UbiE
MLKKVYNPFIEELKKININSILDFGTGELTVLNYIRRKLKKNIIYFGCDLSFNRMFLGKKYFKKKINLFCNSDYRLPFRDNSIDVIMTTHALETNDFHIKKFVNEFYRVSRKAVIMLEPHYEIADKLSKLRMNKFRYLRNIEKNIKKLKLKYSIVRQKYHVREKNPASIFIIKKNLKKKSNSKKIKYINPYTKNVSHDLRLFDIVNKELLNNKFNIKYDLEYGTPEYQPVTYKKISDEIKNVTDAIIALKSILNIWTEIKFVEWISGTPSTEVRFNKYGSFDGWKKMGEFHIYEDQRNYTFIPTP